MKAKEDRLVDILEDGLITKEEFKKRISTIKNNKFDIDAKLILLENEKVEKKQNLNFAEMFKAALKNLKTVKDKQEANKILKMIIKKIIVNDDKEITIYLNF